MADGSDGARSVLGAGTRSDGTAPIALKHKPRHAAMPAVPAVPAVSMSRLLWAAAVFAACAMFGVGIGVGVTVAGAYTRPLFSST